MTSLFYSYGSESGYLEFEEIDKNDSLHVFVPQC